MTPRARRQPLALLAAGIGVLIVGGPAGLLAGPLVIAVGAALLWRIPAASRGRAARLLLPLAVGLVIWEAVVGVGLMARESGHPRTPPSRVPAPTSEVR